MSNRDVRRVFVAVGMAATAFSLGAPGVSPVAAQGAPPSNATPAPAPAAGTPATPAPKYSKLEQGILDDYEKVNATPLTLDQKVQILKAAKEYRSIIRAAKAILDDKVARALTITTDDLHAREKRIRHLEELRKQVEIDKEAAEGVPIAPPAK